LGYIPPASMVACLSSLNKLESLSLGFESPRSRPDRPSPPPRSRVVLPALTEFAFTGMSEYSEDLVARIDTPMLGRLHVTFFLDLVFGVPHLGEFIGRAKELKSYKAARIWFYPWRILLGLEQPDRSALGVSCKRIDWQVSSMALLCGQVSHWFSLVERLDLISVNSPFEPEGKDDIESTDLLELLQPFTAIHSLYVSKSVVPLIVPALQELIGESATEVLPSLRHLFLGRSAESGSIQEAIQPFISARQLSDQPVAVHHWEGESADR